jgi:YVTN family beta-propeller protein
VSARCTPTAAPRSRARARFALALVTLIAALVAVACSSDDSSQTGATETTHDHGVSTGPVESSVSVVATTARTTPPSTSVGMPFTGRPLIPGMPALLDPTNVYSATKASLPDGGLTGAAKSARPLVYVPHNDSADVWVIDPKTYKVIDKYPTGAIAQHVVPSYDLKTLYVNNNAGNTLTAIDPTTGKATDTFQIDAPYNLYFTPDGKYALVMEERNKIIAWRDAHTPHLDLVKKMPVPCTGVNHADFSIDGSYFIASCEFSGELLKIDTLKQEVVGEITLPKAGAMPQDTRLTPDGRFFLVADMKSNGVWEVDGESFTVTRFIPTGRGAHGIYPSRDTSVLYVSNRDEGSISVIDSATREVRTTWKIPGGGSPDMGGITADGKEFWLSGRYNNVVYVINVEDPANLSLITKIPVGRGPHGLAVWPQPGRYSLGHTGNMR